MAAHVYRIVGECAFSNLPVEQIKHALDYAPGMNSFDLFHYQMAHDIIRQIELGENADNKTIASPFYLREFFMSILPIYARKWEELANPKNYEEWITRLT